MCCEYSRSRAGTVFKFLQRKHFFREVTEWGNFSPRSWISHCFWVTGSTHGYPKRCVSHNYSANFYFASWYHNWVFYQVICFDIAVIGMEMHIILFYYENAVHFSVIGLWKINVIAEWNVYDCQNISQDINSKEVVWVLDTVMSPPFKNFKSKRPQSASFQYSWRHKRQL